MKIMKKLVLDIHSVLGAESYPPAAASQKKNYYYYTQRIKRVLAVPSLEQYVKLSHTLLTSKGNNKTEILLVLHYIPHTHNSKLPSTTATGPRSRKANMAKI